MKSAMLKRGWLAWAVTLSWSAGAGASGTGLKLWDENMHVNGFAAQGFVLSDGNNVFGTSTDGTFQYFELGVNGTLNLAPGLVISAQEVVRKAGEADTGKLRLDYAFVDYQFLREPEFSAGARAGKVKNSFGLFNDTRDVVFTRPGILLPDSVYSDITGQQRGLLFSTEGAQLYGDAAWGPQEFSLVVTGGLDRELTSDEKEPFIELGGVPFDLELQNFWQGRLLDSIDGGRWIVAASYLSTRFLLTTPPGTGISGDADIDLYLASLRFNAERFSVTAEYTQQHTKGAFDIGGTPFPIDAWSEGGYVQFDYRFVAKWTAMARFDATFASRGDYDGSGCETGSPARNRHECFALDAVAGVQWRPDAHWGVWGEFHLIDGGFNKISRVDNAGRPPDYHWNIFLLMAAYRF